MAASRPKLFPGRRMAREVKYSINIIHTFDSQNFYLSQNQSHYLKDKNSAINWMSNIYKLVDFCEPKPRARRPKAD